MNAILSQILVLARQAHPNLAETETNASMLLAQVEFVDRVPWTVAAINHAVEVLTDLEWVEEKQ
jgi:hypothetical protein